MSQINLSSNSGDDSSEHVTKYSLSDRSRTWTYYLILRRKPVENIKTVFIRLAVQILTKINVTA